MKNPTTSATKTYNCRRKTDAPMDGNPNVLLNKGDEFVSKCRHRNKFTLKRFKYR